MSEYRALYRKYRPFDFDDVSGQNTVTDILKYEVANGRLSHAYLFCGSRGTGKTSCAKILAKAVNCLNPINGNPCNKCEACRSIDAGTATDVIEMDAASNNGVDNVRDMKDEIAFTPAVLKYRVYIVDEVHMMSGAAFNALLKTLEEPPTYVIFILATTELHKLPTTIVSRCQRFDFRRISSDNIMSRLKHIAGVEGISLTDDGARIIARVSRGGMRDAVSLLELCASTGKTVDDRLVFDTVGSGNRDSAVNIIRAILKKDYTAIYSIINEIVLKSGDLSVFWQEIIDCYRDIMVVKNSDKAKEYLDLTDMEMEMMRPLAAAFTPQRLSYHISLLEGALADMQRAFNSKRSIAEIALTRMCDAKTEITPEALALRIEELEKEVQMLRMVGVGAKLDNTEAVTLLPEDTVADMVFDAPVVPVQKKVVAEKTEEPTTQKVAPKTEVFAAWREVIERISELKPPLSGKISRSEAYRRHDDSFIIRMDGFFANSLAADENALSIIRSVIAEKIGIVAEKVRLIIVPKDSSSNGDYTREIEEAINNINM